MSKQIKERKKFKIKIKFMDVTLCFALLVSGITLIEHGQRNAKKQAQLIRYEMDLDYIRNNPINMEEDETFSVCTINVQNKYTSEDSHFQSGADLVISLAQNSVDIVGTQEMKCSTTDTLGEDLENYQYDLIGEPRWGTGIIGNCLSFANETNSIAACEIYMPMTITLPWIPQNMEEMVQGIQEGSIMARIVTSGVCAIDGIGYVRCYNTHLDYGVDTIQKRQMDALLELIDQDNAQLPLPIIITGDFNADLESDNMKYFIDQLSQRGINVAIGEDDTYKGKLEDGIYTTLPKKVDYIFYSNMFQISEYHMLDNPSSDHKAVLVYFEHR